MFRNFTFYLIFTLILGLSVFLPCVPGAPGNLDLTFSQDGKTIDPAGASGRDEIYSMAVQSDGKIVAAGYAAFGGARFCGVARYNSDGSLDTSFDGDGKAYIYIHSSFTCRSVNIQSDGKIVVAGFTINGSQSDFAFARLNADGSPDALFGGNGTLTIVLPGSVEQAYASVIQPDGKILAGGLSRVPGGFDQFALIRLNIDGTLDTTFDGDGRVSVPVSGITDEISSLALQSDGKIVAAGQAYNNTNEDFAVARFNSDGSLDTSFDSDGKLFFPVLDSNDVANAVLIQPDGKIVLSGYTVNGQYADFALARLNPNGTFDNSFEGDGKVITAISATVDVSTSAALQTNGKIVAAGYCNNNTNIDYCLVRYNSDGTLDTSFDGDGKLTTSILNFDDVSYAVILQNDGRIIAAGTSGNTSSQNDFSLVRYNSDGALDLSFDTDGKVSNDIGFNYSSAKAVAIQPDGKIVMAGYSLNERDYDFALVRYNANGTLDPTFDGDGRVTSPFVNTDDQARAAAIQPDGKIVVAGEVSNGANLDFAIVRYNGNGSPDTSFGSGGKVIVPVSTGDDSANAVTIQPDGKIIAVGYSTNSGNKDFAFIRLNADGTPDTTFNGSGKTAIPVLSADDVANTVVLQSDGKIVAAGNSAGGASFYEFAVVRLNSSGTLDSSFDGDGKLTTSILSGDDLANAAAIQPDGKIVVVGASATSVTYDYAVVRYNTDGSLDTAFDGDGKLTTSILDSSDIAGAVVVQPDGKILAAGYSRNSTSNFDFSLVRYNSNGSLDNAYGAGGKVSFDVFDGSNDVVGGMALDSLGRAVVAGEASSNFAVARVLGDIVPSSNLTVSGRVKIGGVGVGGVTISLTDAGGISRTTRTNSFGFYQFSNVPAGTAAIRAISKHYTILDAIRGINVTDNISDLDFTAVE